MPDALQCIELLVKISNIFDHISVGFFCAELEARVQILRKLSTAFYCQDRKLMCPFSPQAISLFRRNQPKKFEILTFSAVQRNFPFFCQAESETTIQILLKLSTALHCQERKLLCQFFAQAIYLLEKSNQRNLKF